MDCPLCYANAGAGFNLTLGEVEGILGHLVASEGFPEVVQFSGGEPSIHPDIVPMMRAARDRHIRHVMLNTNGKRIATDDAFVAAVEFENGAIGTLEATRFGGGRKNYEVLEINGEKGSIHFNLERLNELQVFWVGEEPKETQGFHNVLVTEDYHPWIDYWWPHGHIIGWEHTFVHELTHLLDCIVNDKDVAPYGASFEDGYRAAVVCDAISESAAAKKQVDIKF